MTDNSFNPVPSGSASQSDPAVNAWGARINQTYGGSVASIIGTGQELTAAKADLGHRRWGKLFDAGLLRFGQRRAQLFMEIVRNSFLANPKNFSYLPDTWSVLHVLSKLSVEMLAQAMASGRVHPELTLKQAGQLVLANKVNAGTPSVEAALQRFDPERRSRRLGFYLGHELDAWPQVHWPYLADVLQGIAANIRALARTADALRSGPED